LRIVFFTSYYPPDLGAGSFRSEALTNETSKILDKNDDIHVVTTLPNRYKDYSIQAKSFEKKGNITIHRLNIPKHTGSIFSQAISFFVYGFKAYKLSLRLKPDFIIGTTGRLMTGLLSALSAYKLNIEYFIDIRDIFSETISDIFSGKNIIFGGLIKAFFLLLEKKVLTNAAGVNVVSEGFLKYFEDQNIVTSNWTFFPNGIDEEFMNESKSSSNKKKNNSEIVLYAGNIGVGQGLELIIPEVAKILHQTHNFIIIGDGAKKPLLIERINQLKLSNVQVLNPIERTKLLYYYNKADILFLHLNKLPAFERVLPSKIFEYGSFGKPILAGVSGYSADFLNRNIPQSSVFEPCNIDMCIESFKGTGKLNVNFDVTASFKKEYSRCNIMSNMADKIMSIIKK
jgi:UDP-N-acetylglucosamine:LPS N-acetylglucosamine transferase